MAIDGALPLCRVKLLRTINNARVSPDTVTATPTVEHITSNAHGYHDLRSVVSELDPDDPGLLYLDLPATDDPDVNEAFAWRITFQGSERPTRLVSVPQTGAAVETIVNADGDEMPAVWLDALADFTGYSGPTAPPTITAGYVDTALDVHEQAADPHPGYALKSAVVTGLAGAVSTAAADAAAKVEAHRAASDPHGDRAAASTALGAHAGANDPHGDRAAASTALTGHVQALDPHGDRNAAATALEQHRTASDPHGDRAAATAAIETHRTATDPHGDRAAAATALESHRTASDPHGDRAAAASDAASKVETHRTASDPHGDRAWATTQLAGKVDTGEADLAAGTPSRRTLGTGANQALPGNHASVTNARTPTAHNHPTGDITGLDTALAGKAATSHTHPVTDLNVTGTRDGSAFLRGDGVWATPPGGGGSSLIPTAPKTAAYTATNGELVLVDATSGPITITAPTTGAGRSFGVKKVDATSNVVTVAAASGSSIGTAAAASVPVRLDDQASYFAYNPTVTTNWIVTHNHMPLPALDARFVNLAQRGPLGGVQNLGNLASGATISLNATTYTAAKGSANAGPVTLTAQTGGTEGQLWWVDLSATGAARAVTFGTGITRPLGYDTSFTINSGKTGRFLLRCLTATTAVLLHATQDA